MKSTSIYKFIAASLMSLVTMQDFSEPWTDEMLYAKYGITPD